MSRKLWLLLLMVVIILIAGLVFLIVTKKEKFNPNQVEIRYDISALSGVKMISVTTGNNIKLVKNLLGSEYLKSVSSTLYFVTDESGNKMIQEIAGQLSVNKWQTETDWGHQNALIISKWKKGNTEATILVFEDLDSMGIADLNKSYGINGLVPKQTLIVVHSTN